MNVFKYVCEQEQELAAGQVVMNNKADVLTLALTNINRKQPQTLALDVKKKHHTELIAFHFFLLVDKYRFMI